MHDIIFISANKDTVLFKEFKKKYPFAKQASTYSEAKSKAFTKLFWLVWDDVDVNKDFNFKYDVPEWDYKYVHVFKNSNVYDGICLTSKIANVSEKEFKHRFFINKKEIDLQLSTPRQYDIFYISSYTEYLAATETATTDMFWIVWPDVVLESNFTFDYYIPAYDTFHKNITHIFKNEDFFNGVCLFSKNIKITEEEFNSRVLTNKKEINIVASKPRVYERFIINNYDDYSKALETSQTNLFWGIWSNIEIVDESILNMFYNPLENHMWKNLCNDKESYVNGLTLFSKNKPVSKKEINHKFLINKEVHDTVATRFRYPRYYINTYDEYVEICKTETQPLFWCIWPEIEITDTNIFDMYFDPLDGTYDYDRTENHVFQNQDIDEIKYNGLMLMSTSTIVSKKEINFRYIVVKKEHDQLASKLKLYDIVFISYYEPNAEENYIKLTKQFPNRTIHRVTNVTGIHRAHIQAAAMSTTPMFWVVDADAVIVDDFKFDLLLPKYDRDAVHVWKSRNPINDLEYGYGGVKLLPTKETLEMDVSSTDMTTSISKKFNAMPTVSNITAFNTDPFNTWKSAFRECVKLASRSIQGQVDTETSNRLDRWCTLVDDASYGFYAYSGALAGKVYGQENAGNIPALLLINDFEWLKNQFQQTRSPLEKSQQ
jgi:hypothetical protein